MLLQRCVGQKDEKFHVALLYVGQSCLSLGVISELLRQAVKTSLAELNLFLLYSYLNYSNAMMPNALFFDINFHHRLTAIEFSGDRDSGAQGFRGSGTTA